MGYSNHFLGVGLKYFECEIEALILKGNLATKGYLAVFLISKVAATRNIKGCF